MLINIQLNVLIFDLNIPNIYDILKPKLLICKNSSSCKVTMPP